MNLTNEQIQQILDGAPEGATKYAEYIDIYYFKPAIPNGLKLYIPFTGAWQWVHDCSMLRNLRDLSDLREILALRQRVQELEAQVPKWISVEDELPPIDTWVLWIDGDKTMDPRGSDYHIDKITERGECLMNYIHNYTHWMPLPKLSGEKDNV